MLLRHVTMSNLVILGQPIRARRSNRKIWQLASHLLRSFEFSGTDADQLATYDFLSVIHSNLGPILYRFQDKLRSLKKISTPVYSMPTCWGSSHRNFVGQRKDRVRILVPPTVYRVVIGLLSWADTARYSPCMLKVPLNTNQPTLTFCNGGNTQRTTVMPLSEVERIWW